MKDFLQPWFGQKNDLAYSYWHGTQAILPSDMVQAQLQAVKPQLPSLRSLSRAGPKYTFHGL